MYEPAYSESAQVWAKYPTWGLRPGDVIEAIHLQEIIAAVDYLIDYGVWTTIGICTRKRTPGQFLAPDDCGYHYFISYSSGYGESGEESRRAVEKCCANEGEQGYWYHEWWPGHDYEETVYPDTCESWSPPTWEECFDPCEHLKCHMMSKKHGWSKWEEEPGLKCVKKWQYETVCDGYVDDPPASPGCGYHLTERGCWWWDHPSQTWIDSWMKTYCCHRRVEGYSYYACTPDECNDGWDANHGGLFKKNRLDHIWHPGLDSVPTGPEDHEFSGNCLGDMYGCGELYPLGPDDGLWFHEVTGIHWRGLVGYEPSWFEGCDGMPVCGSNCPWSLQEVQALPPPIPGYGYHDADGDSLCDVYYHGETRCAAGAKDRGSYLGCDGHDCQCSLADFEVCKGEAAWVAVDLNLDGSGRPYREFPGRNGNLDPYVGRGVPRLRNYDLTKDPTMWMHECPCETWTGTGTC